MAPAANAFKPLRHPLRQGPAAHPELRDAGNRAAAPNLKP